MFLGPLFAIVGLALAVALAVMLSRWLAGPQGPAAPPPSKTALDILKERFARGEIDKAEFEDRRRTLGD
jgi:putative membrane protein